MPLIKGNNAKRMVRDAIVLDLGDLNREAERIIADANEQAEQILAEAKTKADELVNNASERGFAEGREIGLNAAIEEGREIGRNEALQQYRKKLDNLLETWSNAIEQWESDRTHMYMQAREDVLRFASVVSGRVIRRQIECEPTVVQDQLDEALGVISRPSSVTVTINPEDRAIVEDVIPQLLERFRNCEHIELQEDESMMRGGCIVATRNGTIDASIERQLQRIVQTILPDPAYDHTESNQQQAGEQSNQTATDADDET